MSKELTDELKDSLKAIVKLYEDEDKEIRKSMIRSWKKNEEFWYGVQFLFWSDSTDSWKTPLDMNFGDEEEDEDQLGSFSDKVIDIFRAHGEAIIAALAAQIPAIRFLPDDADSASDLTTSRTYSKIAELVARHNKAKLIFLRALFFLAIHGLVASYRYKDSDFNYGSYKAPKIKEVDKTVQTFVCTTCDYESEQDFESCPQCGQLDKEVKTEKKKVPVQVGMDEFPKTRAKVDIFGPLHFKVRYFARNQTETPYLILYGDQGKDAVKSVYTDLIDDIDSEYLENTERFSRASYQYPDQPELEQRHLVTVKKIWLRSIAFYNETDKSKRESLLKTFPDGCRIVLIGKNNLFAECVEEKLDERWTIGQAGLSTYIYSDPILRPLVMIQEMRNQLVNLIMETIEHGIPWTGADPETFNFDTAGRFEAVPGYIYKMKPRKPGEAIGNSFYTSDRSTLSREVALFLAQLDKDAQFCIGSFPSIYGGPSEGKSRTFAEYAASRQMALQRLSIVWTFLVDWWVTTIEGCVKMYIECLQEDEKFTKFESGNYVNVWIRRSELVGKIGGVESEASETFPISLAQKKDVIMKLIELNNEYINSVIFNPENARIIQDCFALTELKVPGESQRVKQVLETYELLRAGEMGMEPIEDIGPDGLPMLIPFVPIDPEVDDHKVHIVSIKSWAVSDSGIDCKKTNQAGYAQAMAHLKMHEQALIAQTLSMGGGTPAGEKPETAQVGVEG
jgi:hypothetical protein